MWDLHRLHLLRELQLRGTVSAVAAHLNYSPSTVSHQLAQLEREVGCALLEPDGRRVRLTPHGVAVAEHAARVMDLEERVRGELGDLATDFEVVRVAALQSAARELVPRALTTLATTHPGLRMLVTVVPPEQGLFELEARGFDLAIAEQYPGHTRRRTAGLERELLADDPIHLAVPEDDDAVSLADVAGRPWVLEPAGTAARTWAEQQCRAAGFEPDVRYEASDLHVHVNLVGAGHAVGMLPALVRAERYASVRLLALPGSPHREVFTVARAASGGSAPVRAVRDALVAAAVWQATERPGGE
ncbi:LysR family transcriptional regulator [Tsukamurella sp. 8F]|uniref:LysR family transcriptional regulator n=1 Tax=unclassified Tsukamurella TaxID=2633480 RepID=UPI0023B892BA|nr:MULTISPECIES: LysR family transcriptional regulator [unclassified Tsukamurella]MDF0530856.1 LysR family transcriptional regulator [Tsukamurella sp. 8J]MDF0588199.1 LysR family transcriptional regulator [Tsukamurella sp. 8F]